MQLTHVFILVGMPVVGLAAVVTLIFVGSQFQAIVNSTASGGKAINWGGDTWIDMMVRVPHVVWLFACSTGPAMLLAGLLAKHVGAASFLLPLFMLWLIYPIVQLSSLYASSGWIPFTPMALVKMAGKAPSTFIFYMLSLLALVTLGIGTFLCFMPTPLRIGGIFLGAFLMAGSVFAYARLLGRLAFCCSFVGVKEEIINEDLPQYSAEKEAPKPKKKKVKRMKQRSKMQAPDTTEADDGVGYNVKFDQPVPIQIEPEPEKEFVPPKFHYDTEDDDATPYMAHAPEVKIQEVVTAKTFEVKESEIKLLRCDDEVREPREMWTPDVLTDFVSDKETWSQMGIAVICFVIDGLVIMVMQSFL